MTSCSRRARPGDAFARPVKRFMESDRRLASHRGRSGEAIEHRMHEVRGFGEPSVALRVVRLERVIDHEPLIPRWFRRTNQRSPLVRGMELRVGIRFA